MKNMESLNVDEKSTVNLNTSLHLPELKRVQSVKQMIKAYRQQQLTIKSALGNLDKKPMNKIIFDEEHDDFVKVDVTKNKQSEKKKSLFQSDDEEEESYNFEVKDQFTGKEGQQLYELQSKFKGDKRFNLDERFIENNNESTKIYTATSTELSLEEEKRNEIDILQEVLGTKVKSNKHQESSVEKHMLRFDPTQSHHKQYEIKPSNNKMKKNKKDVTNQQNNEESQSSQQPNVSKDVFYKVGDDLRNTFQSQQGFSLLNSFSQGMEKENDEEIGEEPTAIENKGKLYLENNPFRYDSSEDELENVQENVQSTNDHQPEVNFLSETFFFKDDDFRLQEGSDFVKRVASESNSEFVEQRRSLKNIVKAKVRNNNRKNNPFKKKLGGNKRKKILRIRKALKR